MVFNHPPDQVPFCYPEYTENYTTVRGRNNATSLDKANKWNEEAGRSSSRMPELNARAIDWLHGKPRAGRKQTIAIYLEKVHDCEKRHQRRKVKAGNCGAATNGTGSSSSDAEKDEKRRKEAEAATAFLERHTLGLLWLPVSMVPEQLFSRKLRDLKEREARKTPILRLSATATPSSATTLRKAKGKNRPPEARGSSADVKRNQGWATASSAGRDRTVPVASLRVRRPCGESYPSDNDEDDYGKLDAQDSEDDVVEVQSGIRRGHPRDAEREWFDANYEVDDDEGKRRGRRRREEREQEEDQEEEQEDEEQKEYKEQDDDEAEQEQVEEQEGVEEERDDNDKKDEDYFPTWEDNDDNDKEYKEGGDDDSDSIDKDTHANSRPRKRLRRKGHHRSIDKKDQIKMGKRLRRRPPRTVMTLAQSRVNYRCS